MMALQEHSLYDDPRSRYEKPAVTSETSMFLDLKEEKRQALLTTPDVSEFTLSTPEVQKMLTSASTITTNSMIRTPTPSSLAMIRHSQPVAMDQEMYAASFLDRLDPIHAYDVHGHSKAETSGHQSIVSGYSTGSNPSLEAVAPTYVTATFVDRLPNFCTQTTSEPSSTYAVDSSTDYYASTNYGIPYRHEAAAAMMPGTTSGYAVMATPSIYGSIDNHTDVLHEMTVVPDMKTQEQMKVERKKARNRIAASKCRLRRLQRESELQSKVNVLKDHNKELNDEVNGLKEQISNLKKALVHHMKTGCKVSVPVGLASPGISPS